MRSFLGQRDHMQVFKFILDCLDSIFDQVLTHAIRLVDWLKRSFWVRCEFQTAKLLRDHAHERGLQCTGKRYAKDFAPDPARISDIA